MEHHADAGLARAPATVGAAPGCLGHQACALQGGLGPGVAPGEAMVGAEMVVEVLDRPARMAGSVLLKAPIRSGRPARGAPRRLVEPSIEQSVQRLRPRSHRAGSGGSSARSRDNPSISAASSRKTGVVPASAPAHSETSCESCVPVATSSDSSQNPPPHGEPSNRTTRVLHNPDTSCASDSAPAVRLKSRRGFVTLGCICLRRKDCRMGCVPGLVRGVQPPGSPKGTRTPSLRRRGRRHQNPLSGRTSWRQRGGSKLAVPRESIVPKPSCEQFCLRATEGVP